MEAECRTRSHTDPFGRELAEENGACRGTETINDHRLTGRGQALILQDIASDLTASIIGDAYCRDCVRHALEQQNCRKESRHTLHVPPLGSSKLIGSLCVMREAGGVVIQFR